LDLISTLTPQLVAAALFVFAAAVVRGFTGLGFALIAITSVSLLYPLQAVVPAMVLLELIAGVHLFWSVRRDVHWESIRPLMFGIAAGTPFGLAVLIHAPGAVLALALGLFTILTGLMLMRGFTLRRIPGTAGALAAGATAGATNGAFGIGGPPVFLFYLSSPAGNAVSRASIIACFLGMDLIYLPLLIAAGMMTPAAIAFAAVLAVPLVAGIALGSWLLRFASPEAYRRLVLWLVLALGLSATAKAVFALWSGGATAP
jgi:uncharacterized membrane protein YfcA